MRINDFCKQFSESEAFRKKSRLLIIPNQQENAQVRSFLAESPLAEKVRISECITQNKFLPAPRRLFVDLEQKIRDVNQAGKTAFVTGLDAIMELWALPLAAEGYGILRDLLGEQELSCLFLSVQYGENAQTAFESNPRYKEGQTILRVGEEASSEVPRRTIRIIAKEFRYDPIQGSVLDSLSAFIREHENGLLADVANICVDSNGQPLAGIREDLLQVHSRQLFLKVFCALDAELSEQAIDWLYGEIHETPGNALAFIQRRFCKHGVTSPETLKTAPQQIVQVSQAEPQVSELLVWMLKSSLPEGSYLHEVLSDPDFKREQFLNFYVCEALNLLEHPRSQEFAEERKAGLQQIGTDFVSGELAQFIRQSRDYPEEQIVPWLNLQTDMEKHELLRRFMASSAAKVPPAILKVYPLLRAYMEPYKLGLVELNGYFDEYRMLKIKNLVTQEFCERAKQIQIHLPGISTRDALVQQYAGQEDTALLVVDGLGAEYLPLLISLAQRRNLGILTAEPAFVRLPTSTEFNSIQWPNERRLQEIKSLDNNLHNGAEMHTVKPQEEDFAASLEIFEEQILPAAAKAMTRFSQVVLTSDHGATRLAACASQQGMAQTIPMPDGCEISDWRYTKKISGMEMDSALMENLAGTHWIVKGYDRLPKKGPKLHEMHGGATYEECLVPFIVFKQGAVFVPKAQQTHDTGSEFVENSDFDL